MDRVPLLLEPDWPHSDAIIAACTTRRLDHKNKKCPLDFNLASHVDDAPENVNRNRRCLREHLALPIEPFWLNQLHSSQVVCTHGAVSDNTADASYASQAGYTCVVLTADCLPVLFRNRQATWVAAAHAGWRGLVGGVLQNTLAHYPGAVDDLEVWLGPAIGAQAYEVGDEVYHAFINQSTSHKDCFMQSRSEHWYFDLYHAARNILSACGVSRIYGGQYCTYTDHERFYSYRREGQTGRMASLIGLKAWG